jgi:hypothetical protein
MDEWTLKVARRVESSDKLAFNLKNAAFLLDISYSSLRREIKRRKICPTPTLKLITRDELLRYLNEEEQLARRLKRGPVPRPTPRRLVQRLGPYLNLLDPQHRLSEDENIATLASFLQNGVQFLKDN